MKAVFHWAEFCARSDILRATFSARKSTVISTRACTLYVCSGKIFKMAAVNKRFLMRKLLILLLLRRRTKRRQQKYKKNFWVRKIFQERTSKGEYHLLVQDLKLFDHLYFFQCFRMTPSTYEKLLSWVGPLITRKSTTSCKLSNQPFCCWSLHKRNLPSHMGYTN